MEPYQYVARDTWNCKYDIIDKGDIGDDLERLHYDGELAYNIIGVCIDSKVIPIKLHLAYTERDEEEDLIYMNTEIKRADNGNVLEAVAWCIDGRA